MRAGLAALLLLAHTAGAAAQVAIYADGSVGDLDPPAATRPGAEGIDRAIITSSAAGRMRAARAYHPDDLIRRLGRPVGRLSIAVETDAGRQVGYCTATLIAEDLLLTNHHCIARNPAGRATEAVLWMGYLKPRSSVGVERYDVTLDPVEDSAALDYAIHRVDGAPGAKWGTVALDPGGVVRDLQSLFVVHHPGGREQHVSLACATHSPALDGADMLHLCDTLPGSSGAPVFDNESRAMVGLHYRAVVPGELNAAKRLHEIVAASPTLRRAATPATMSRAAEVYALVAESRDTAVLKRFIETYPDTPEARAAALRLDTLADAAPADEAGLVRETRDAAEAGDRAAMYRLGDMYFAGDGVPRDQTEAIRWYQRAATVRDDRQSK
ncbi:trypsin-like peptidase domain-containing protein [Acuticoccus sp. M5D2P5]|uniref:trypsin-like peptidase domain-containing protein n=1 Tax=Acuticoccus kalidii TaxID=2910977 RepID=UPI001F1F34EC|nr:trypsin-like peptidase domain-containing protein [Acuticoccus kalidii]MCF3932392.1 trypsin-like peptidase domain-containing protein [Acuticoccus kalidii]